MGCANTNNEAPPLEELDDELELLDELLELELLELELLELELLEELDELEELLELEELDDELVLLDELLELELLEELDEEFDEALLEEPELTPEPEEDEPSGDSPSKSGCSKQPTSNNDETNMLTRSKDFFSGISQLQFVNHFTSHIPRTLAKRNYSQIGVKNSRQGSRLECILSFPGLTKRCYWKGFL